jgi:acetyl-CoA carboxylase biotin carboxyl carrier protein
MAKVLASMSGTVWKVLVEVGQSVSAGQEVLILESMKMEIPHSAEVAGTVVEIKAPPETFVNEGDVLIVIE